MRAMHEFANYFDELFRPLKIQRYVFPTVMFLMRSETKGTLKDAQSILLENVEHGG